MNDIRLLIVDDSMPIRDFLKKSIFDTFPYMEIQQAGSGDEAQKMLQTEQFDIVLSDWEMPGLSGIDLLRWVRSTSDLKTLPFVMVTGTKAKESIIECIQAGVTDYIVKPFTADAICRKIKQIMQL